MKLVLRYKNKDLNMNSIIRDSLSKSQSYESYRDLVNKLSEHNATTGAVQSEALINYTKLNDRRMKRWDKTIKVPEDIQEKVNTVNDKMTWLVITESWCGDAAHLMPAMNKLAALNENIDLRVVLRDENEALMDRFLTNGTRSIPKLILIDDGSGEVVNTYGPRPSTLAKIVSDFKNTYGKLTPEFKEDLQHWYNRDKGQTTLEDLVDSLEETVPSTSL
jgi:thiol-disulfide isomerase/thioredoxin